MFEFKYWIDEKTARNIREFIHPCYMEEEEYSKRFPGIGYAACNIYLDDAERSLYRAWFQEEKNWFKLRARIYDNQENSPAFLEIKRCENQVIKKHRIAVTREGARRILLGERPKPEFHIHADTSSDVMDDFCELRDRIGARGSHCVFYRRQAFATPREFATQRHNCRVTLDRRLDVCRYRPSDPLKIPSETPSYHRWEVMLALRFSIRKPNWMAELMDVFELKT